MSIQEETYGLTGRPKIELPEAEAQRRSAAEQKLREIRLAEALEQLKKKPGEC